MGALIELRKDTFDWMIGKYSKAYVYISDDSNTNIYLLKPVNEQKHIYVVRDFEKIKTTEIAKAIYALLHEEGKNRKVIHLRHESGIYELFFTDTTATILKKITEIDFYDLTKKIMKKVELPRA